MDLRGSTDCGSKLLHMRPRSSTVVMLTTPRPPNCTCWRCILDMHSMKCDCWRSESKTADVVRRPARLYDYQENVATSATEYSNCMRAHRGERLTEDKRSTSEVMKLPIQRTPRCHDMSQSGACPVVKEISTCKHAQLCDPCSADKTRIRKNPQ